MKIHPRRGGGVLLLLLSIPSCAQEEHSCTRISAEEVYAQEGVDFVGSPGPGSPGIIVSSEGSILGYAQEEDSPVYTTASCALHPEGEK